MVVIHFMCFIILGKPRNWRQSRSGLLNRFTFDSSVRFLLTRIMNNQLTVLLRHAFDRLLKGTNIGRAVRCNPSVLSNPTFSFLNAL